MKLYTERLILRSPTPKDIGNLIEGMNNLNVSRYLAKVSYPYTIEDAKWWINHVQSEHKKRTKREGYSFNIELKDEKKLIGGCGLHKLDRFNESVEIGYWLNENYWRKGIATEACSKLIDFVFKDLKLNRITLYAYVDNEASNALARKLGFSYEGCLRDYHKAKSTGKIQDANVYGLLKTDWKKLNKK